MIRLGLCAALALIFGALSVTELTSRIDLLILDHFQKWTAGPPSDRIVLVEIDDASLAAIGRWPWSRGQQASLVAAVAQQQPRAIGLALLLTERDAADPEGDADLVAAVAAARNVVLPVLSPTAQPGEPVTGERLPWPELASAALAVGHVNLPVNADGMVRGFLPSLAGTVPPRPAFALALYRAGQPRERTHPTHDPAMECLIPMARAAQLSRISAAALLAGDVEPGSMAGATVLIGVTASGIDGGINVPVGDTVQRISALEYHGLALSALEAGQAVMPAAPLTSAAVTALVTMIATGAIVTFRHAFLIKLAMMATAVLSSLLLLALGRVWISPSLVCIACALCWSLVRLNELRLTRLALIGARARNARMLSAIGDAVLALDRQDRIRFANPAAARLIGQSMPELIGRRLDEVTQIAEADFVEAALDEAASVATLARSDGQSRIVRIARQPLDEGSAKETMLVMSDISAQVTATRELARLATHDPLTDLPNRKYFIDRLQQGIERAKRTGGALAVLFVDLDRFKTINDGLGHAAGDRVLIEVARRLRRLTRSSDTVARLGGDEFVLLLDPMGSRPDAGSAAVRVLEATGQPFLVDERDIGMTCSVGIGIFPDDGASAVELLRNADSAMYRSKQRGRSCFHHFSPEMDRLALERLEVEHGLRQALRADELLLHYQPTVELDTGQTVGVEALLRWRHPTKGLIGPSVFIPIAEETGLILPMGEWVIGAACRQGLAWAHQGLDLAKVAVNLSVRQFRHGNLLSVVRRSLEESGLPPERLMLEVTESLLMEDIDGASEILSALKSEGVQIALDDFGTGYSSLNYLKRLPLDCLKIDRSFVQRIGSDADDEAIVRAIIGLAGTLRLRVIAEGVESEAQAAFLRDNGCATAQGYLFGRPVPPMEVARRLAS